MVDNSPVGKELNRVNDLVDTYRKEILAINYYNAIMGTDNVHELIDNTINTINKYRYLGSWTEKIKTDNLFPERK